MHAYECIGTVVVAVLKTCQDGCMYDSARVGMIDLTGVFMVEVDRSLPTSVDSKCRSTVISIDL